MKTDALRSIWPPGRGRGWPAVAALLGAGALFLLGEDAAPVKAEPAPEGRVAPPARPAASAPTLHLDRLRRAGVAAEVADLFSGHSWTPPPPEPPPPPVQAAPAPAPVAAPAGPPALPFTYVGKLEEEGARTIFYLERGPAVLTVVEGDKIDSDYRLDAATAGGLDFTHLPTQSRQTLRLPE